MNYNTIDCGWVYLNKRSVLDLEIKISEFVLIAYFFNKKLSYFTQLARKTNELENERERRMEHTSFTRPPQREKPPREKEKAKERDKKQTRRPSILPPKGQPRGLGDPLRKGLSGVGVRWYLRHLEERITPEEARKKVDDRKPTKENPPQGQTSKKRGANQIMEWEKLKVCVGEEIPKANVVDIFFPKSKEMEEELGAQHHQYFYKDPLVVRTDPPLYYIFSRVSKIDIILSLVLINSRYIPKFTHNSHIFHSFNNSHIIPGFPSCWQSYKRNIGVSSLKYILLDEK